MRNPEREAFKATRVNGKPAELSEEAFFEAISHASGFTSPELCRDMFYGMIKVMTRELRTKKIVKLPGLGHFLMVPRVAKVSVVSGVRKVVPEHHVLHFRPVDGLKEYLKTVIS